MIAILSPAKTLDLASAVPPTEPTRPRFGAEAAALARSASRLPQKRLRALMGISPALAKLNHDRFVAFDDAIERPAVFTFAGDVYRGLDAMTLDEPAIVFAQDHVRLLSGLYGLLRPLDLIRPYRLEMGVKWAPRKARLTDWWGDRVAAALATDVAEQGDATVLNLASNEYWAAVEGKLPAGFRTVAFDFREGPERRFVSFNAKHARGAAARWLVENRADRIEAMQSFDWHGYRYVAAESDPARWRFVRD